MLFLHIKYCLDLSMFDAILAIKMTYKFEFTMYWDHAVPTMKMLFLEEFEVFSDEPEADKGIPLRVINKISLW